MIIVVEDGLSYHILGSYGYIPTLAIISGFIQS